MDRDDNRSARLLLIILRRIREVLEVKKMAFSARCTLHSSKDVEVAITVRPLDAAGRGPGLQEVAQKMPRGRT